MCIAVFMWNSHPLYPFLLLLNRDEYHNRPTTPLGWWEGGEILGGRDGEAGGTWLGCTRSGKLAFLTNVREITKVKSSKSRGDLPVRFFKSKKSPEEFAHELVGEDDQYNGFNLIAADLCSMTMLYITNRPGGLVSFAKVSPGIHVLTNAQLDTPWPKAERLRCRFEEQVRKAEIVISMEEMTKNLMNDTSKDDDETILPRVYPPEFEYLLSSIFVEAADTPLGRYGTRSTSGVILRRSGEISFYERNLEEKDMWNEQTVSYHIDDA